MRGRPKLSDSRNNQYRVRLNDVENKKLSYVSDVTGKPKSEIFRDALADYYNKVRVAEINGDPDEVAWEIDGISLKRVVECPHCGASLRIDLEAECSTTSHERQMGPEILYEFDLEDECDICGGLFRAAGYVSEYPVGALNHENIHVTPEGREDNGQ